VTTQTDGWLLATRDDGLFVTGFPLKITKKKSPSVEAPAEFRVFTANVTSPVAQVVEMMPTPTSAPPNGVATRFGLEPVQPGCSPGTPTL
jgi:hypothetical protein